MIDLLTPWVTISHPVNDNGWSTLTEQATAVYAGRGEFYSGLRPGDECTVQRETAHRPDGTVAFVSWSVTKGGAWLSIYPLSVQA